MTQLVWFSRVSMVSGGGVLRLPLLQRLTKIMNASHSDEKPQLSRVNVYEVRPATTGEGFDVISEALSGGCLRLSKQHVAIGYATLHSGSRASVIRVYDGAGELIATHEQPAGRDSLGR